MIKHDCPRCGEPTKGNLSETFIDGCVDENLSDGWLAQMVFVKKLYTLE